MITSPIPVKLRAMCFIIDCPMNALMASFLARNSDEVHLIYALDPVRKDIEEYLQVSKILLAELNVVSETIIEFDSARFWGGEKNALLPSAHRALAPLIELHGKGVTYFGNCLTNPVALALKRFALLNHLYHAPSDFVGLLFAQPSPLKSSLKNVLKRLLKLPLYRIETTASPVHSLLNFGVWANFQYVDFYDFSSDAVAAVLLPLRRALESSGENIMLLLAGDEAGAGDKNHSNIAKYVRPHLQTVERLMNESGLKTARLWLKEHKSYFPLVEQERALLVDEFSRLGCSVRFVADYLPKAYRLLPGECILKYCHYSHIIAEPSSFLLNVAGNIDAVAAVSPFTPYRNIDQINRNNEFVAINALLKTPCRVY